MGPPCVFSPLLSAIPSQWMPNFPSVHSSYLYPPWYGSTKRRLLTLPALEKIAAEPCLAPD